jgi:hypothetical protein
MAAASTAAKVAPPTSSTAADIGAAAGSAAAAELLKLLGLGPSTPTPAGGTAPPAPSSGLPSWIPLAVGAVLLVVLLVVLMRRA